MEENFRKEEEGISLMDIVRLLLSKIKILILVVLIGGILGGSFAVWRTYNIDYYGTSVEFYVNPEKPKGSSNESDSQYGVYGAYGKHVMDNMVKLLSSESFAELLILDGEILPRKNYWVNKNSQAEMTLDLDGKIDLAQAAQDYADGKQKEANDAQDVADQAQEDADKAKEKATEAYTALQSEWKKVAIHYEKYSLLSYSKPIYEAFIADETITSEVKLGLKAAYEAYEGEEGEKANAEAAQEAADEAQEAADEAQELANDEQKKANVEIETALEAWRKTAKYRAALSKHSSCVRYSYLQGNEAADDADSVARSFIYVRISVLNDHIFANDLLDKIKTIVPEYVEANMAIPSGYEGTNCQRITRTDNIALTNAGFTTSQAIKYGLLVAVAAFVVACIAIILVDKSDKRLRELSVITNKFNFPVLGVIPSIEMLEQNAKMANEQTDASETENTEVK